MEKETVENIVRKQSLLDHEIARLHKMDDGAFCMHQSWGFGQIKSYDKAQNRLLIVFEDGIEHAMDPIFCARKLEILDDDNVLVRFHRDRGGMLKLAKEDPVGLIIEMMTAEADREVAVSEIERVFSRIIGELAYRKWWASAKKLLANDLRIGQSETKSNTFVLREEPVSQEDAILEQLHINRDPVKRVQIAEKILALPEESRVSLSADIAAVVDDLSSYLSVDDKKLTLAQKLHCCWVRNDLASLIGSDIESLEPSPESIIRESSNFSKLVDELPGNCYQRFLGLITCAYPDEWESYCSNLLKNSKGKFTNECVLFLMDRGCEELLADNLLKWLNERSLKSSILLWLVKNRHVRKFMDVIPNEIIGPRLLKAVLMAVDTEALLSSGTKRIPLADILSEDRNLIKDLLAGANGDTARDLAQILVASQGFDDLTKRSLLARFVKEFPEVQTIISSKQATVREDELFLMVSQASFDIRTKEYEAIVNEKIPANKRAIEVAREHGDLRENSEYKMAKQDQDTLLARKAQLESEVKRAKIVDFSGASDEAVSIGTVVKLKAMRGKETVTYTVLGAWDSDPAKCILSYKTPLGQALLGKKVGDMVTIKIGQKEQSWTVQSINKWVDNK
ncbi:MAG: transcription elongation factor GreA [Puniceicoccales bacterium]|jgi:transcription elongation factor GreA|nr:transcription elongation factor GreA [Puniceicoccales bacterium]